MLEINKELLISCHNAGVWESSAAKFYFLLYTFFSVALYFGNQIPKLYELFWPDLAKVCIC